ncbi:MAG: helicase associated domain-containing protein [bacterium]
MARQSVDWEDMFRALEAYSKEHGDCQVPANWKKNLQLGRWVAMQRYRHKIGELTKSYVVRLTKIGFVWSPADKVWNDMYQRLVKYKKKHGHCDVPSSCPSEPDLANWVANQRHRKKMNSLAAGRVTQLEEAGFVWSVYGKQQREKVMEVKRKTAPVQALTSAPVSEERLYQISGEYIQYNGTGEMPPRLAKYVQLHNGNLPSCIILPRMPLVFRLGGSDSAGIPALKIKWAGKGPLPEDVLEYLNETGALPPHGP